MAKQKLGSFTESVVGPRQEYLTVAESIAKEKGIETEYVLSAIEAAIERAACAKYGTEYNIEARINKITGDLILYRKMEIVERVNNSSREIHVDDAKKISENFSIGEVYYDPLPPVDFGRVAAQTARTIIIQKVKEAERKKQYDSLSDKVGGIISGIVKRVEFGDIVVDLGLGEGILKRDHLIPRETYQQGDRIRSVLIELRPDSNGPIAFLSRTHPLMMARLFEQEVPEVYEGLIEIKAIARDPGSRAKMAVYTSDPSIDAIGSCVGVRGSRVQAVSSELHGEKVDLVAWSPDVATYLLHALQPAQVSKVVIDEETRRVDVIVPQDQLSLAIGRRGQNVRLASILTDWGIDIMTEEQDLQRRLEENNSRVEEFMKYLDVDDILAQLLCAEGFETIEDIVSVEMDAFISIEGFDEDLAQELKNRAITALEQKKKDIDDRVQELNVDKALMDILNKFSFSLTSIEKLINHSIRTRDDLAELSADELLDIIGRHSLSQDQANDVIMTARAHWF